MRCVYCGEEGALSTGVIGPAHSDCMPAEDEVVRDMHTQNCRTCAIINSCPGITDCIDNDSWEDDNEEDLTEIDEEYDVHLQ